MNLGPTYTDSPRLLSNALECMRAAAAAYKQPATFETALAHVLDIELPDSRIIAFRGSANTQDWLTDFRCLPTDAGDGIKIHRGFYDAIKSIADQLVARLRCCQAPIFITGHSLGGALAILAAKILETALSAGQVHSVFTFGGPRVGNTAFANVYDSHLGVITWRFVHEEDIVPRVPFWVTGYRHVGQEVFLPSTGGYRVGPPLWSKCLSDAIGLYQSYRSHRIAPLADHSSALYLARLESLCAKNPTEAAAVA